MKSLWKSSKCEEPNHVCPNRISTIVLYSVKVSVLSAWDRCHGCVYYMITPWHLTWTRTVISSHNHNYCTDQTHSWAHPWHTAHYCCEEDLDPGSFVKIDFVPQHKRCLISIWWKFCVGQSHILPFPLDLMMALNIYLYKLMITNEPFCPVCLPDPDTSLSFFVGTLQKYTVTEHWQKQQNILPRQKILGSPHKTNCDQMTQKSPKTPNCGSVPITRALSRGLGAHRNLQLITIIISDIK